MRKGDGHRRLAAGISLVMRAIVNPGDVFVVERRPTGGAATLELAEASIMSVSSDSDGMVVEELAELLKTQRIKGVYVVPNWQLAASP